MLRKIVYLTFCLLLVGSFASAQQTTARIVGTVLDSDGNPLPGVTVEGTSPRMVGKATSITDENGTFRLLSLTPGLYKLVFTLEGFQTLVREGIQVNLEQTITMKETLQVGRIEEQITIIGQSPLIDVKSTVRGLNLTKDIFETLPKGRNFDGLMAIIPGVVNENFLGGMSIDGSSGGENMFYIDGQNTNTVYGGTGAQSATFEFLDEVQIKASGYAAEFGGSLGGVVNVITRSGGNEYHGEVLGYYSGSSIRGTERDTVQLDPFSTKPILQRFNYDTDRGQAIKDSRLEGGFGLGGYIVKDKLWFYANALPVLRNETDPAVFLYVSDPDHVKSDIAAGVFNRYNYKQKNTDMNLQMKLSVKPTENIRLAMSFVDNSNMWNGGLPNRNGGSSDQYSWDGLGYNLPNYSGSANLDYTSGNNLLISARVGYFYLGTKNKLDASEANTAKEPIFVFVGTNASVIGIKPENVRGTGWQNRAVQSMTYGHEVDTESNLSTGADATYFLSLAGEHAWKAGVAFTRATVNKNTLYDAPLVRLSWTGTRGGAEVRGGPNSRDSAEFGKQYGEFGKATSDRLAIYLQDSWTIANKLTLNFGVRMESENVPSFNDDLVEFAQYAGMDVMKFNLTDKIAPRAGFIYDFFGDSSFKVYGSYGVYNDVMELDMALGSFGGMRWISDFYYLQADHVNEWMNIGRLMADGVTRDYSMLTFRYPVDYRYQSWGYVDPNLKPMAQREISLGLDKKLGEDLTASVRGVWRSLIRTIDDVGVQVPNDQGGFDEVYYIANPGYGWAAPVSQGGKFSDDFWPTPKAERDYKALNISIDKRMSNNWMAGVNLTVSRLFGNYTGIVSADEVNTMGTGYGRPDGNVTRYFDVWWMSYTQAGTQTLTEGRLPTDRPIVVKGYGSYAFPFGLTVGAVVNYMSGTPKSTEWYVDRADGYYPLGRGDLGRTPNLFFANVYAEYVLDLGKNKLHFSINIDNVTNASKPTWYWTRINVTTPYIWWTDFIGDAPDNIATIKGGYDFRQWEGTYPQTVGTWLRDARYNQPLQFQPPITARLGVKFTF